MDKPFGGVLPRPRFQAKPLCGQLLRVWSAAPSGFAAVEPPLARVMPPSQDGPPPVTDVGL